MSNKFDLFRFSLLPREQMDITSYPDPTREEYLRMLFSEEQQFVHYGTVFHYVPSRNLSSGSQQEIIGRIGRSVTMDENLPPSANLEDSKHETWKASVVVIDPTDHQDGQKASIQVDQQVGKPDSIMKSLVNSLNERYETAAYHIEVAPISEASTFWQFAEENAGNITTLTFTFVAPNMFGGIDNITEEMRRFRDEEKAQRVKVQMSSDDGIDTDTDNVRSSVEYTTRGGGDISARAKGGRNYNSKKKNRHVMIEGEDDEPMLVRVARNISKVLGRE